MPNRSDLITIHLSKGARKFSQFLARYGLTQAFAAARLECAESTLHDWLTGAKRPDSGNRWRIERWTSGTNDVAGDRVNAVDWSDDGFLVKLRTLEPYRPQPVGSEAA